MGRGRQHFRETFTEIENSLDFFWKVNDEKEMGKPYVDEYTTNQQRLRDKKITELLNQYVDAYSYKNGSNKWYKGILLGLCSFILLAFCIVFVILMFQINGGDETTLEDVIKLISVCITFLTLIVGILKIITKYVFPEKEEEYITRIVEIIQNNDLENKKENIRAKSAKPQKGMDK